MAIGYTYQSDPLSVFGSKSGTTRTAVTLTATYTDNTKTITTGGMAKLDLSFVYTTGTAETNNVINLKVETSSDGTNFYQLVNESVSSGTSTLTQREFQLTGASAATAYSFSLPLDVQDKYMKFSVKETGVATNYGTVYAEVVVSGEK